MKIDNVCNTGKAAETTGQIARQVERVDNRTQWDFRQAIQYFGKGDRARKLLGGLWGLEKEAHRVLQTGELALTDHPEAFGNKLHHPTITVDFAESQLELVTPPHPSIRDVYNELHAIYDEAEQAIGEERLWPLSMPPILPEEERIPIARFDRSEQGRLQEIYRKSLALRYGIKMQMISGLHYNYSFSPALIDALFERWGDERGGGKDRRTFTDAIYFKFARNFLRYRWLLIYLFGASPAADPTYHSVICDELRWIGKCFPDCCDAIHHYEKYAVSLRVSRFGYSERAGITSRVSYNDMAGYVRDLETLLTTTNPRYEQIGLYQNGEQVQLNTNLLQTESEFYSSIRLKRRPAPGESTLEAIKNRGIDYAEIRLLDLNPYERVGIGYDAMHFLHLFMLYCLLEDSPPFTDEEYERTQDNHHLVSLYGRKPELRLYSYKREGKIRLTDWAENVFKQLEQLAAVMSEADGNAIWKEAVAAEWAKVCDPDLLPAAKMMREMAENGETPTEFGLRMIARHYGQSEVERSSQS